MTRRRLPSLKAVRAFEAAARHGHFEQAGAELGVTAGAIAQQVKILETWLGLPLFRRLPAKGVALTAAGERYAASARDLLDGLAEATARLLRQDGGTTLTVSTVPSLAANSGDGLIKRARVILSGSCCPSRMACVMSGASRVRRSTRAR
jgi:LysR family transcriptional regulator, glycine cleavage system transcriptional activator